jgi:Flp pilus assembly protein TadG
LSAIKWSLIFLLVVFPLFLLLGDFMAHTTAVDDANTATRNAAQSALKANIVKESMRDFDKFKDNILVQYNSNTIQSTFNGSLTRRVAQKDNGDKGYITVAEGAGIAGTEIHTILDSYPVNILGFKTGGRNKCPPMLAVRSNVVRTSLLYKLLSKFVTVPEYYGFQTQKITVLEVK